MAFGSNTGRQGQSSHQSNTSDYRTETLAKLMAGAFGRGLERVLCLFEMKSHQLASLRRLLGLDRIHYGLVRIHDLLDLRQCGAAAQARANGGFQRAVQSAAENLE